MRSLLRLSVFALSMGLLVQTTAFASLSTYMGLYVQDLMGLPSTDTAGYFAGWLNVSYTFGNIVSAYGWGRFSDRFGRKPVMIVGVCSTGLSAVAFGLCTTFSAALTVRFLFGLTNCMMPMARVVIVELLGPEDSVVGVTVIPGTRAIGNIIGPAVGGYLAQPATLYPSSFSSTGLFGRYPFLLPNVALGLLSCVSFPLILFFLPETLSPERAGGLKKVSSRSSLSDCSGAGEDYVEDRGYKSVALADVRSGDVRSRAIVEHAQDPSLFAADGPTNPAGHHGSAVGDAQEFSDSDETKPLSEVARSPGGAVIIDVEEREHWPRRFGDVSQNGSWFTAGGLLDPWRSRLILVVELLILAVRMGFDQIYPLWLLARAKGGGLQWSLPDVGKVFGWAGIGLMVFQFVLYPALCRTVGVVNIVRASAWAGVLLFLIMPDVQRLAWSMRHHNVVAVVLVTVQQACLSTVATVTLLAAANAVPANLRGQFSGLVAVVGSLGRGIGPAILGPLLAWSMDCSSREGEGRPWVALVYHHVYFAAQAVFMLAIVFTVYRVFTFEVVTIPIERRIPPRDRSSV